MTTFLEKVGLLCLVFLALKLARALFSVLGFVAPFFGFSADLKSMGRWAVITGSTDGLGKGFAEQLAKQGMDIVLISRSKQKLDIVAKEIEDKYKVCTKVIEADFTEGSKVVGQIEKELFGLDVGVLVNNVGVSYPHPELFLDLPNRQQVYSAIIDCNIVAMLVMCQIVMPSMVEQRRGAVINVSSTAAEIPSPLLSVYGASKVFVSKFTRDLATEYRGSGIVVQCLVPGLVATSMSRIRRPSWMAPSPQTYVASALATVGVHPHTTGYYPHSLLLGCINLMKSISPMMAEWMVTRTMANIRARAIRKVPSATTIS